MASTTKKIVEYTRANRVSITRPVKRVGLARASNKPMASKVTEMGIETSCYKNWGRGKLDVEKLGELLEERQNRFRNRSV